MLPPLIGDSQGQYKVHIVGNSVKSTREEMQDKLQKAMAEVENRWVINGNWVNRIGSVVEDSSTDLDDIWLDPPLILYFPRIVIRTFLVMLRLREPCSPGCFETSQSLKMRRLSGWGSQLRGWWHEVQAVIEHK
ncbi:hypothetical protein B0H13DRAFT_2251487 [Mycena leptocephala]|nr:hypothetical protein B0H13DRAFT_2251487 [Mycena leptocephala]